MLSARVARACPPLVRNAATRLRRNPPATVPTTCRPQSRQCSNHSSPSSTATLTSTSTSKPLPKPPADHRDIGVRQKLFTHSIYSPGSPIFLPAGAIIFNRLVDYLRRKYVKYGFQEVITPTIYKKALWAKSGHLENYAEDMFTVTSSSPSRRESASEVEEQADSDEGKAPAPSEEDEYALKPMNCPGHCLIFNAHHHSYRDLPVRYADFSPLHRNEISGALSGLTRVRRFHQDDGHIFCRPSQIEDEIRRTLDFVAEAYDVFRLGPYRLVLSTRPDEHYIGSLDEWDQAEAALARALDQTGRAWTRNAGDGAFYGPKIDIILKDSDGKEHQTATIQLDFQLPKRFDLAYDAPAPELERQGRTTTDADALAVLGPVRPVMIHRAVLGSVERLMALLIEHYDGKWPFWLNPRQVMIVAVNDTEPVLRLARETRDTLLGSGGGEASDRPSRLTVDLDYSKRGVGSKIHQARTQGYGVVVVVGPKNVQDRHVDVTLSGIPSLSEQRDSVRMSPDALLSRLTEYVDTYR